MLQHIESFDPLLAEDQLFNVLSRSPSTCTYLQMRAKQLILEIMQKPMISSLKQSVASLSHKLEQNKTLSNIAQSKVVKQKQRLQLEIEELKNKEQNHHKQTQQNVEQTAMLKKLSEQNEQLSHIIRENQVTIVKLTNQIKEKTQKISTKNDKLSKHQKQIENLEFKNNQLNSSNIVLLRQIDKLRNNDKILKQSEIQSKKVHKQYENQIGGLERSMKDTQMKLHVEIAKRDNQRKQFHQKLRNLTAKHHLQTIISRKLRKVSASVKDTVSMNKELEKSVNIQIQQLQQKIQQTYIDGIDEISLRINQQLQYFRTKTNHMMSQIQTLKQSLTQKDQELSKLKKDVSQYLEENMQLKKELRGQKVQCETLRKELKGNFEESHAKLQDLQKSYREILFSENVRY